MGQRAICVVLIVARQARKQKFRHNKILLPVNGYLLHLPIGVVVVDAAAREGGLRFDSRASQTGHSVATSPTFLRSCVVQVPSRGDESRHSLHDSAN